MQNYIMKDIFGTEPCEKPLGSLWLARHKSNNHRPQAWGAPKMLGQFLFRNIGRHGESNEVVNTTLPHHSPNGYFVTS